MGKVEIINVVKRFGKTVAVDHVSFKVEEGEVVSLLGPSGCGKTTLLRCVAGLEDIDEGEIFLGGKLVTSPSKRVFVPPEKRRLGLVFQSYALWPNMTVYKNIAYGLEIRGFPKQEIERRVKAVLELVGLEGLEQRYPYQLSGGQQQRVALARSLVYDPEVLLLDEPLSNLDLKIREKMREEIRQILKRTGITAIYVTHDQEEAFAISDRVIIMNRGRIVQEGRPEDIYEHPADPFVAEFIGRSNILEAQVKKVDADRRIVIVEVPSMKTELLVKYDMDGFPENCSSIVIRANEIGVYPSKPEPQINVVEGEIVSHLFRGPTTIYQVQVGDARIRVSTHKFCSFANVNNKTAVYLYFPPEAIKLLRAKQT